MFRVQSVYVRVAAFTLLAAAVLITAGSNPQSVNAWTATGGGYTAWDSEETGGPIFGWISNVGLPQVTWMAGSPNPDDDDISNAQVATFTFFGAVVTQYQIDSNGRILFNSVTGGDSAFINENVPQFSGTAALDNQIAGFWDDLSPPGGPGGTWDVTAGSSGGAQVITWTSAEFFDDPGAILTFQVALYANGGILVQYQTMSDTGVGTSFADGSTSTIGIEDTNGTLGINYMFNNNNPTNSTYNSLAVGFLPTGQTPPWPVGGGTGPGTTTGGTTGTVDPGFGGNSYPFGKNPSFGEGQNGDSSANDSICSAATSGSGSYQIILALLLILVGAGLTGASRRFLA